MTDYPYLYYVNEYTGGVCVKKCPNLNGSADPYTLVTYDGLYQVAGSVVTDADISVADYSSTNNTLKCTEDMCYPDGDPEQAYKSAGVNEGKGFASFAVDTYELMWRCVFTDEGSAALNAVIIPNGGSNNGTDPIIDMATQNESIKQAYDVWHNLFADLWVTRYYILAFGFGFPLVSKEEIEDKHLVFRFSQMGPLTLHRVCPSFSEKVVGFLYAFMMRIPGVLSMMVWASIFATVGIFFFGGYYAGKTATEWSIAEPKVYTDQEIMIATYSGYAMYAVGGLLVLLFLFMRKRIQMAMGCVKEASKAMLQMPLIIFFPVGNTRNTFMGPAWANLLFCSQAHPLSSRFFPPLWLSVQVLQGLGFTAFMVCWTVYAVNIASMGEYSTSTYAAATVQVSVSIFEVVEFHHQPVPPNLPLPQFSHLSQIRSFEFSDFVEKCGWYMLFCFFWSGQFILAMGQIVFAMAGESYFIPPLFEFVATRITTFYANLPFCCFTRFSVAKWYFARDKSTIGNTTVLTSITTSLVYHSGTAAFGALIIAIIKMIRSFIAYLQRKAEEMNSSIAKCILCCFQCCFFCLEKCMRFLNKNAYIQTAIFGSSFCTSAKEAFFLILRCVHMNCVSNEYRFHLLRCCDIASVSAHKV